jgi:type II secretory pathway predicted ATPase ExeA
VEPSFPLARGDCFPATADPAAYVALPAAERALAALRQAVLERRTAALLGGPGVGKTLLLRVLGAQLADRLDPVYAPYAKLPQSELCALLLGLLGHAGGEHPEGELLALAAARRARGRALLLLVDDAGSMPEQTARGLAGLVAVSHGGLRLVVAAAEEARAMALLEAVGPGVDVARLPEHMDAGETGHYVRRHVARALGPEAARAVDSGTVAAIHRASQGVPRDVHRTAPALLDAALAAA